MKLVVLGLAFGVFAAFSSTARADGPQDPYGPPGANRPPPAAQFQRRAELRQMILERFDRNQDGRLEPRERRQAARALRKMARRLMRQDRREARNEQLRRRVIERYDLNGDGNVGPGEMPPNVARRLRHLDRNHDGWVDDADQ